MARRLKEWLTSYEKYTKDLEAPGEFHRWVGIGTISAALGRSVWLDHGAYELLPNHYIILLASSAACRKSTALSTGYALMKTLPDLNLRSGNITTAMLYKIMSDQAARCNGVGEIVLLVDELSNLFGKDEHHVQLISMLTEGFLGTKPLRKETKTQGVDIIPYPCINILAATTPADMQDLFPEKTSGMGFTPRCIIVHAEKPREKNPWPQLDRGLKGDLIADLLEIQKLKGAFKLSPGAVQWYDEWYKSFKPLDMDNTIGAFNARKHDYVLKLAMVLSVSESDGLVVDQLHMMKAVEMLDEIEPGIQAAFMEVGRVKETKHFDRVLRQMRENGGSMSRRQLLHANWNRMDVRILMGIMENLIAAGYCEQPLVVMNRNKQSTYTWTLTKSGMKKSKEAPEEPMTGSPWGTEEVGEDEG